MHLDQRSERAWDKMFDVQPCWQVLLLKYRNGGKGLQKTLTDVSLEHHEECACVCKDDWDWPPTVVGVVAARNTRDVNTEPLPLYLIHFHWKLTRPPTPLFYPAVLRLTGLSRSDWNLVNLIGSDCCGIPIVLLWVPFFFKDGQKRKTLEQILMIIFVLWRLYCSAPLS